MYILNLLHVRAHAYVGVAQAHTLRMKWNDSFVEAGTGVSRSKEEEVEEEGEGEEG